MASKAMRRAERSAPAITHGSQILQLVRDPKIRARLVHAAELGSPPVTAISSDLRKLIGKKATRRLAPIIKQFSGLCVRGVLEEAGFQLVQRGVRISKDPIFKTASVYRRSDKTEQPPTSLLVRFINSLTDDEIIDALTLLQSRRPG